MVNKFRGLLYFLFVITILLLSMEGTVYILYKLGPIKLIDKDYLAAISNSIPEQISQEKPMYIPHPYFGYIYTPNNCFFQQTVMKSNSEGFIDEEFPLEKQEGLCIYGLLGGSGAMSWGVEKKADRISYQLEELLNTYATNGKYKKYRVLNMGVGSHLQYQATQIYLYYQDLLDGVIFYNGNNECSHASVLATEDPVPFPEINICTMMQLNSPLKYEISALRNKLSATANFLLSKPYLLQPHFMRFFYNIYFKNKLQTIDKLNENLFQDACSQSDFPQIKGKLDEYRSLFQKVTANRFWYSDLPDFQREMMKKVVPIVYTAPLIDAFAVAKIRNTPFLSVVQPLPVVVNRKPEWGSPRYKLPIYQKYGNQILMEEAKKLEGYGIKTYNLNSVNLFNQMQEDPFIDQTHLKPQANKIVARYLFELIQKEWHGK